jgi:methionyl-tRNA formyltransferase
MARLIFMGSPDVAVPSLRALTEAGHEIPLVVTQPDRPKGRGQKFSPPPVKEAALELGLRVLQPKKVTTPEFIQTLKEQKADGIVVVAYGRILPKQVIEVTPWGCLNVHFSLLPKFRGAACVAYALMEGEEETGTTTMLIDEGMDTGPILLQWSEPIYPEDTSATLSDRLAHLGAKQIVTTIAGLEAGNLKPVPQDPGRASQAPRLKKEQGHVDWGQGAAKIYNLYRGLTPWPGIYGFLHGKRILLSELRPMSGPPLGPPGSLNFAEPGTLSINCGDGRLQVMRLKPEGKRVLPGGEFMRGLKDKGDLRLE